MKRGRGKEQKTYEEIFWRPEVTRIENPLLVQARDKRRLRRRPRHDPRTLERRRRGSLNASGYEGIWVVGGSL